MRARLWKEKERATGNENMKREERGERKEFGTRRAVARMNKTILVFMYTSGPPVVTLT